MIEFELDDNDKILLIRHFLNASIKEAKQILFIAESTGCSPKEAHKALKQAQKAVRGKRR